MCVFSLSPRCIRSSFHHHQSCCEDKKMLSALWYHFKESSSFLIRRAIAIARSIALSIRQNTQYCKRCDLLKSNENGEDKPAKQSRIQHPQKMTINVRMMQQQFNYFIYCYSVLCISFLSASIACYRNKCK